MAKQTAHILDKISRRTLNVFLNSRKIGVLQKQSSGAVSFQYDPEWLGFKNALPVSLSLPLRERTFSGAAVQAVFENLLPDNDAIRRMVAEKTGATGTDAYSLLSSIGRDCVGALQFLPEGKMPEPAGDTNGRAVSKKQIGDIIDGLSRNPLGMGDDDDFRISIAGAQEKTALLKLKGKWLVPHGASATTHILKPAIGKLPRGMDLSDSVENEHFCMKFASFCGLDAASTEIAEFGGHKVLVVERFDRLWTEKGKLLRLPQEDCCQALSIPPSQKYEPDGGAGMAQIMALLQASNEPEKDRLTFMKAQILFWLLGATDGHAKNFSLYLLPEGRFRLTPLYDIMSAQPYLDRKQLTHNKMKLAMAVGKNRHYPIKTIQPRHFIETGKACGLSEKVMNDLLEELRAVLPKAIDKTINAMPKDFPMELAESIARGVKRRGDFEG